MKLMCGYRNCNNEFEWSLIKTYCSRSCKNKESVYKSRDNNNGLYKIYKLVYKGEIVYIGQTKHTLKHRFSTGYTSIPFYKDCSIELIEETSDVSREDHWINFYLERGIKLLNKRSGNINKEPKKVKEYESEDQKLEKTKAYRKEYYRKYNLNKRNLNKN